MKPTSDVKDWSLHWIGAAAGEPMVWVWVQGNWETPIGTSVSPEKASNAGHRYLGVATCPYLDPPDAS
jgi:hypothetical protein